MVEGNGRPSRGATKAGEVLAGIVISLLVFVAGSFFIAAMIRLVQWWLVFLGGSGG